MYSWPSMSLFRASISNTKDTSSVNVFSNPINGWWFAFPALSWETPASTGSSCHQSRSYPPLRKLGRSTRWGIRNVKIDWWDFLMMMLHDICIQKCFTQNFSQVAAEQMITEFGSKWGNRKETFQFVLLNTPLLHRFGHCILKAQDINHTWKNFVYSSLLPLETWTWRE